VKHDNVVPFDPTRRGGSARRGSPDKDERSAPGFVALKCPACASALRLDARHPDGEANLLCGRCETEVPLVPAREGVN
jgi:hypothetical protein